MLYASIELTRSCFNIIIINDNKEIDLNCPLNISATKLVQQHVLTKSTKDQKELLK
jgi:hypothetical protein